MQEEVEEILATVKKLASRYKKITGKPLGVTGEVAEYNAATLLGLELAEARTAGYDAVGSGGREFGVRVKTRGNSAYEPRGPMESRCP